MLLKSMTEVALPLNISRNEFYRFLRNINIVEGRAAKDEYINKGFFRNYKWRESKTGAGKIKYHCLYATPKGEEMLITLYRLLNPKIELDVKD
jgi:phage antirepressor YoqD-like protein